MPDQGKVIPMVRGRKPAGLGPCAVCGTPGAVTSSLLHGSWDLLLCDRCDAPRSRQLLEAGFSAGWRMCEYINAPLTAEAKLEVDALIDRGISNMTREVAL